MFKLICYSLTVAAIVALGLPAALADETTSAPDGWQTAAPRPEIRPQFAYEPKGGRDGKGSLVIAADEREGLDGYWVKTFPITGGQHYRFFALRKIENIASPRRSVVARIIWQDGNGKPVLRDEPVVSGYLKGAKPVAEPEYPTDKLTDAAGWTEVSDIYRAPSKATRAVVELHLQWAPRGKVEWSGITFAETQPPPERKVRLAAVHYRPQGDDLTARSPLDNCRQFAPLIAEAARQRADLVVLGETLTYYGLGKTLRRSGRADPRPIDRVLRRARQEAQPLHRRRPARARRAPGLQRRRADRARRQARRQVPQGVAAARRDRRRASRRATSIRSSTRASASSA